MAVKIAVIGVGLIGPRHCQAVLKEIEATLICVVDPSPPAVAFARDIDVAQYENIKSMLASEHRPDAAIICTPNHTHVTIAEELLNEGIHVLVEKPLCVDIKSGRQLVSNKYCE